jgi:uncharacterized protein
MRLMEIMSIHIIPVNKLSTKALKGVIEEFISRGGTDYGAVESSLDTKFNQVKNQLENGLAVLVFDDETETTNIFLADDPILKKLDKVPGSDSDCFAVKKMYSKIIRY